MITNLRSSFILSREIQHTPKVILFGHIVVPESDLAAVMAELPRHVALTLDEEGCLRFEVVQDPDDEHVFKVYEEFVDPAAFEAHQRRVSTSDWGKITANVERHYAVIERD